MTNTPKTRTRFAPSPTGYMHIGSLRTALFCYLFAKQNDGSFLLRIEDTDRERLVPDAVEKILSILDEFGMRPDEGPGIGGQYGPYVQSERIELYQKYAKELVGKDFAYYEQGEKGKAIKFRLQKEGATRFADEVYGDLEFKNEILKDPVILKSDGYPVYNFANVIDDHYMEITHVMRGEEFLSSTPIHIQLYQAFSWKPPTFVHLPLILDGNRKKLSKRTGDVAVEEYLKKGYLHQSLLNFIALLGWNPKTTEEIFSLEELIEKFSIDKLNRSGAIFDGKKLDYLDKQWRHRLDLPIEKDPLYTRASSLLGIKNKEAGVLLKEIWPQIVERSSGPSDLNFIIEEFRFYFDLPDYPVDLLAWKDSDKKKTILGLDIASELAGQLVTMAEQGKSLDEMEKKSREAIKEKNVTVGEVLWPLRVALSGSKKSPGPFEIILALVRSGKKAEIEKRLQHAKELLT